MDKKRLYDELIKRYQLKHKKSEALFKIACEYEIRGGSHNLRLFEPFPFYDVQARGSKVTDVDGHTYIDFWPVSYTHLTLPTNREV